MKYPHVFFAMMTMVLLPGFASNADSAKQPPAGSTAIKPLGPHDARLAAPTASQVDRLSADIRVNTQKLAAARQQLQEEEAALDSKANDLKEQQAQIDTKRSSLDQSDPAAVAAFNHSVNLSNDELDSYEHERMAYNASVVAFDEKVDALNAERDKLEQIAANSP